MPEFAVGVLKREYLLLCRSHKDWKPVTAEPESAPDPPEPPVVSTSSQHSHKNTPHTQICMYVCKYVCVHLGLMLGSWGTRGRLYGWGVYGEGVVSVGKNCGVWGEKGGTKGDVMVDG